jgi:gamma-glutamyltranspeptidase
MTLGEAVEAERIHHGFAPDEVQYERARPPSSRVTQGLRARGHELSAPRRLIGDANAIAHYNGTSFGYADTREGGLAMAPALAAEHPDARD